MRFALYRPASGQKRRFFWTFVLHKQCSFVTAAPIYARSSLLGPSLVLDVQRPIHWPVLAIMGPVHSIFRIGYFLNGGIPVISSYRKCHVKDETIFKSSYLYHGISQSIRWRLYIESAPRPLCFDRTVPIWCHLVMTAVDLQRTVHVVIWYYNILFFIHSLESVIHQLREENIVDHGRNTINVNRCDVVTGTVHAVLRKSFCPGMKIYVTFCGEDGEDGGGLSIELMRLFHEQVLKRICHEDDSEGLQLRSDEAGKLLVELRHCFVMWMS